MMRILLAAALAVFAIPAFAADLGLSIDGLSINVGAPGFYGRIDIGDNPKPEVIYTRPIIVYPEPDDADDQPIYLHVPPGYEKHWSNHCDEYRACGRPVYFVRDSWYRNSYAPRHREYERDRDERHEEGRWRHHH